DRSAHRRVRGAMSWSWLRGRLDHGIGVMHRAAVEDLVGAGVAHHLEPAAASGAVIPELLVRTARIVAQVHVVDPRALRLLGRGPPQRGVAAIGELDLVARPAPGAWDQHHRAPLLANAPTDTARRLFRRSCALLRNARA